MKNTESQFPLEKLANLSLDRKGLIQIPNSGLEITVMTKDLDPVGQTFYCKDYLNDIFAYTLGNVKNFNSIHGYDITKNSNLKGEEIVAKLNEVDYMLLLFQCKYLQGNREVPMPYRKGVDELAISQFNTVINLINDLERRIGLTDFTKVIKETNVEGFHSWLVYFPNFYKVNPGHIALAVDLLRNLIILDDISKYSTIEELLKKEEISNAIVKKIEQLDFPFSSILRQYEKVNYYIREYLLKGIGAITPLLYANCISAKKDPSMSAIAFHSLGNSHLINHVFQNSHRINKDVRTYRILGESPI